MKTLFTKKTIAIAACAVIIAIITLVSVNAFGTGGPVTGLANAVSRPLKTWASAIARTFENIYGSIMHLGVMERKSTKFRPRADGIHRRKYERFTGYKYHFYHDMRGIIINCKR